MDERLEPFFGGKYLEAHFQRTNRGRPVDRMLIKELGSTPLASLVEHNASLSSLNLLKLGILMRRFPETVSRALREKKEMQTWNKFTRRVVEASADKPNFSVVQIGANDGLTNDRLRPLIIKHKWRALLVEPLDDIGNKLEVNYENYPSVTVARCAVAANNGPVTMYRVDPNSGAPEYAQLMSSTKRSVVESFPHLANSGVVTQTVDAMTLYGLYDQYGVSDPDFVFIDAEGCDYDILTQMNGRDVPFPRFLVLEHDHMTGKEMEHASQILASQGYTSELLEHDIVSFR